MRDVSYSKIKNKLTRYHQQHLLKYYAELNEKEKFFLLKQIESIDFAEYAYLKKLLLNELHKQREKFNVSPIRVENWGDLSNKQKETVENKGWELLRDKKIAVVLLAGGQGSRLRHNGPKGTLNIGLPSRKSLFQLQSEQLLQLKYKLGHSIPWYIMTNPFNYTETKSFFEVNNYFGYDKSSVTFFAQRTLPTISSKGNLFLEDKSKVSFSPDGSGGVFESLLNKGIMNDLNEKGVEWIFLNFIDNALVKVADPKFIGFASLNQSLISSKSVKKNYVDEKVGIFCKKENRPFLIEYSETTEEIKGNTCYEDANIGVHLFHVNFIQKHLDSGKTLPYHFAHKSVRAVDQVGNQIIPDKPNGYKPEKFYFDIFQETDAMSILQVDRKEEFAPIKNKNGNDSPETAKKMILSLFQGK